MRRPPQSRRPIWCAGPLRLALQPRARRSACPRHGQRSRRSSGPGAEPAAIHSVAGARVPTQQVEAALEATGLRSGELAAQSGIASPSRAASQSSRLNGRGARQAKQVH